MKKSGTILLSLVLLLLFHSCIEKRFGFRKKYRVESRWIDCSHKTYPRSTDSIITASSEKNSPLVVNPKSIPIIHFTAIKNNIHVSNPPHQKDSMNKFILSPVKSSCRNANPDRVKKLLFLSFFALLMAFLLSLSFPYLMLSLILLLLLLAIALVFITIALHLVWNKLLHRESKKLSDRDYVKRIAKSLLFAGLMCFLVGFSLFAGYVFTLGMAKYPQMNQIMSAGVAVFLLGLITTFLSLEKGERKQLKSND